ncbi:MAG: TonB-dependent receptor plug domain-containing protein [Gammaproteobacteria bacterium]|nr:TonB-dependent receptor plug domain-containing protein [Gammaproteobacteria bacterium]
MNSTRTPHSWGRARLLALALPVFAATAAFAQTAASPAEGEPVKLEKFTVTGSYLPLTAEVSASPVVILERSKVGLTGATDALQLLKSATPFFSGNGNVGQELNNGGSGQTFASLRNLTTLDLINGRRSFGDLSNIPVSMIERVEILKDSASTVYGSDAIGGVINFILRKNYNGYEVGARQLQSQDNQYNTHEAWMTAGVTVAGGFITVGAQYFENSQLGTVSRPLSTLSLEALVAIGGNPANPPNYFSSSFPGRVTNDILAGLPQLQGKPGYNAAIRSTPGRSTPLDAPQTLAQLRTAGIYVPILTTAGGSFTTASLLNTSLYDNALIVPTKRKIYTLTGEKELMGKKLVAYADFLYSDTDNAGTVLAPAPLASLQAAFLTIPANNPYNVFGVTLGLGQAAGAPSPRFRLEELGKRTDDNQRFYTRTVVGFKGDINDNYSWDVAFMSLKGQRTRLTVGGGIGSVLNQAMIPLLDTTGTQYVKNARGQYLSVLTDATGANLPIFNYFALAGFNDPATLAAIRTDLFRTSFFDTRSVDFRLNGRPFTLPAGDFNFVLGGESRRERVANHADSNFTTGGALGFNAVTGFPGGARRTRSVYAEAAVPLTNTKMNVPGAYTLDLTLGYRAEFLSPGTNTAKTPKVGLLWKPFDNQLVIRGTWNKGFIAPSILALFGPPGGNSPSVSVPLSAAGFTGPGGAATPISFVSGQFLPTIETSNPNLPPSRSESYGAGFVYSPKQVKGLSFSMDYYHIKQDGIGGFDYTGIAADLNAKGVNSIYAAGLIFVDGSRMTTAATNQVTSTNVASLTLATNPQGDQWTDGLDLDVDYKMNTADMGYFNYGAKANVLFNYKGRANPSKPYVQYARNFTDSGNGLGNSQGNLPSFVLKPYLNWSYKDVRASLSATYLPEVWAQGSLFGGAQALNNQRADGKAYKLKSYTTVDLSATYVVPHFGRDWAKGFAITAGVLNLADNRAFYVPGAGSDQSEANTNKSTYDIIGRRFFLELKKEF